MRRTALAVAALLAASPALAAGAYVTRNVQDVSGFHTQGYWDESGVGTGPFDPVYQLPNGAAVGGGSSSTPVPLASGTGGTSAVTLGTAPTSNAIAASSTRKSLLITNQSPPGGATVTVCTAASGITPAAYVAGCYTLQPGGGFLSYPPNGYVPQDAFNAVASAANTPVTVEAH